LQQTLKLFSAYVKAVNDDLGQGVKTFF